MDEYTYSLRHDVRWNSRRDTLRLVRTTPDGCTTWISEGLTVAQWRAVLATLPAEDGDAPPVEVAEASISAKLARVTDECDKLRKIVEGYEDAHQRLVRRAVAAATSERNNAKELRECAEAAERRSKELDAQVESAKELPVDLRTSAATDVADALEDES